MYTVNVGTILHLNNINILFCKKKNICIAILARVCSDVAFSSLQHAVANVSSGLKFGPRSSAKDIQIFRDTESMREVFRA